MSDKPLTYKDAMKLLSSQDSKIVGAIDKLFGGVILAAGIFAGPGALTLLGPKTSSSNLATRQLPSYRDEPRGRLALNGPHSLPTSTIAAALMRSKDLLSANDAALFIRMAIENGPKTADVDYYLPLLEPALELTGRLRDIHDVRSSVAEDDWSALQLAKVLTGRLDLPHLLGVNPLACVRIIRLADRMGVSVEVFAPELDSLDLVMGRVDLATISDQSIVREVVEVARDYRLLDWSAHVGVPSLLLAPAPIIAALPPRDVAFLLSASVAEFGWYASAHALFKRWARARGLGSLAKAGPEESAAWLCDQFMVEGLADNSWAGLGEYFGLVRRDDR